jgi:hypothetical protein
MEYLRRHVPYWTHEPVWTDWFDKDNPQASIDEDSKRKYDLGEQFIADINERYEGPQLNWLLVSLAHHGYWWKRKTFVSGRSPTQLSIFDTPVENSQLDLVRCLPVRNHAGTILEIQPNLFRNT